MVPRRACRALVVAGAFACILTIPLAVHAQSPQPAEGEDGAKLPVSLERIREGIQREPKLKIDFLDPNIPLFRVHVQEKGLKLEDYWKIGPDTAVSRDVRPFHASAWHNEFLKMTTPPQQIAASPFGIFGNPMIPVGLSAPAITNGIKQLFTNMQRARIRRQIQEELQAIEANQAAQPVQQASETAEPETAKPETAKPKPPPPSVPSDPR